MKRICLADWDGTLRRGYTTLDWLNYLQQRGEIAYDHYASCEKLADEFKEGKVDYVALVVGAAEIYASAIKGLEAQRMRTLANTFVNEVDAALFSFAKPLLNMLSTNGLDVVIISGAPAEPLVAYAEVLPIHRLFAVDVEVDRNGRYTGHVIVNHGLLDKKREAVRKVLSDSARAVLAIGNSSFDIPLFEFAESAFYLIEEGDKITRPDLKLVRQNEVLELVREKLQAERKG